MISPPGVSSNTLFLATVTSFFVSSAVLGASTLAIAGFSAFAAASAASFCLFSSSKAFCLASLISLSIAALMDALSLLSARCFAESSLASSLSLSFNLLTTWSFSFFSSTSSILSLSCFASTSSFSLRDCSRLPIFFSKSACVLIIVLVCCSRYDRYDFRYSTLFNASLKLEAENIKFRKS